MLDKELLCFGLFWRVLFNFSKQLLLALLWLVGSGKAKRKG